MTSLPVLYSFRRCPYAMRARLAIAVSGQQCELREVVLRNKPQSLLDASPKGTVPVLLQPNGAVIEQSLDIMLWALRQNDPQGWLMPGQGFDPTMLELIGQCDGLFKYHLDRYKYPQRFDEADPHTHRVCCAQWLQGLDDRMGDAPFLSGSRAALVDMAIAPFVRQFAHIDLEWFQAQPWPALRLWLDTFKSSALFERIMQKYAPWQPGAAGECFP